MTQKGEIRKPPNFRFLRIAFSVACAIICLVLIVLWVRSYAWREWISGYDTQIRSEAGWVRVNTGGGSKPSLSIQRDTKVASPTRTIAPLLIKFNKYTAVIRIQYWFLCVLAVSFAAIPWIHWSKRFSLRTLLIAMTLIATLLGIIAISIA